MAIVTSGGMTPLDYRQLDLGGLLEGDLTTATATRLVVSYGGGDSDVFTGVGFTYGAGGAPDGGVITGYEMYVGSQLIAQVTGLSGPVAQFMTYVLSGDTVGGVFFLLRGHDHVNGSAFGDYAAGGAGDDTLNGLEGDDYLIGNNGNDRLEGGDGVDTAGLTGAAWSDCTLVRTDAGWTVTDKRGTFGVDTLLGIEQIEFSDKLVNLSATSPAVALSANNILRTANGDAASMLVANGLMSHSEAITTLVKAADATTSVATLSYQFFTGRIPSLGGIDYLVSPSGPNPNNLNSAYYQGFNLENRYINFAVNLGKLGEGQTKFTAEYGDLTLQQATKKAYGVIFGSAPSDTKVAALLAGGRDLYFEAYGRDGPNGIGAKAAMVGWLLAEAEKADLGIYARSNAAFLADLADGANWAVDLVGVYGKAEFVYGG